MIRILVDRVTIECDSVEVAARLVLHLRAKTLRVDDIEEDADEEVDEATAIEDEPEPDPDYGTAVKPKLVAALKEHDGGLEADDLVKITGLPKKKVQAGLVNHRGKTFDRSDGGIWTLIDNDASTEITRKPRSQNKRPDECKWHKMVATLLKSDQPLKLEEIASITRIPKADLFKVLEGDEFERDTDRMYWLAK